MRRLVLLGLAAFAGQASAATFYQTGFRADGRQVQQASGGEQVTVPMDFLVKLRPWQPSWLQRSLVQNRTGQLAIQNPRISWACPPGKGKSATNGGVPSVSQTALKLGNYNYAQGRLGGSWNGHVLQLPNFSFQVKGAHALSALSAGQISLNMQLQLPGPASAWTGCTPTLHGQASIQG